MYISQQYGVWHSIVGPVFGLMAPVASGRVGQTINPWHKGALYTIVLTFKHLMGSGLTVIVTLL